MGNWPEHRLKAYLRDMYTEIKTFRQRQPGTGFTWKTTTLFQAANNERNNLYHTEEHAHAEGAGINVTDAHAVTKAIHSAGLASVAYIDLLHFRPFVYEQFNDLLLNQLCD